MPLISPENVRWRLKQVQSGKIFDINATDNYMVGRSQSAHISLNSNKTSRTHSFFVVNIEGHLLVQDLKSVNGTFVNHTQIPVYVLHRLFPGDEISFGVSEISLSENDRDRQTFFIVQFDEGRIQDLPPNEVNLVDSTTDSRENIGAVSIDSDLSSGKNTTAEIRINSHKDSFQLPSTSSSQNDCFDVIEITSSIGEEEMPDAEALDDCFKEDDAITNFKIVDTRSVPEKTPERKKVLLNTWLQKLPSPKKRTNNRRSAIEKGKLNNSKKCIELFETSNEERKGHTRSDVNNAPISDLKREDMFIIVPSTSQENLYVKTNKKNDSDSKITVENAEKNYPEKLLTKHAADVSKRKSIVNPNEKKIINSYKKEIVTNKHQSNFCDYQRKGKEPSKIASKRKSLPALDSERKDEDENANKNNNGASRRKSIAGVSNYLQKDVLSENLSAKKEKVRSPEEKCSTRKVEPLENLKNKEIYRDATKISSKRSVKALESDGSGKKDDDEHFTDNTLCRKNITDELHDKNSVKLPKLSPAGKVMTRRKTVGGSGGLDNNETKKRRKSSVAPDCDDDHGKKDRDDERFTKNTSRDSKKGCIAAEPQSQMKETSPKTDALGEKNSVKQINISSTDKEPSRRNAAVSGDLHNKPKITRSSAKGRKSLVKSGSYDEHGKKDNNYKKLGDENLSKRKKESGQNKSSNDDDELLLQLQEAISGTHELAPERDDLTNNDKKKDTERYKPTGKDGVKNNNKNKEFQKANMQNLNKKELKTLPSHHTKNEETLPSHHKNVQIDDCDEFSFSNLSNHKEGIVINNIILEPSEKHHDKNKNVYIKDLECSCQDPGTSSPQKACEVHMLNSNKRDISGENQNGSFNVDEKYTSFSVSVRNSKSLEKSFTTDKDNSLIIDITDEDDDIDVSSSQIFEMSQKVKSEVQDDAFQKIKNELAEMDFCNEETIMNPVPINLENDFDMSGFENTQAICAYLEDGIEDQENQSNDNLISNEENEELLKVLKDSDKASDDKDLDNDVEDMDISFDKESSISPKNNENVPATSHETMVCVNSVETPMDTKSPVIKPHSIPKPKKDPAPKSPAKQKNKINKGESIANANKRKNSLETPTRKKKLKGSLNSVTPPRCDSKSIEIEFKKRHSGSRVVQNNNKSLKEDIREERRKKLKEITERHTPTNTNENRVGKGKTVKVLPDSKTRRGGFLCEEPTTSKLSPRPKTPNKDLMKYKLKALDLPEPPRPSSNYNLRRVRSSGDIKADLAKLNNQPPQTRYNLRHSSALDINRRNIAPQNQLQNNVEAGLRQNVNVIDPRTTRYALPTHPVNATSGPSYANPSAYNVVPPQTNQNPRQDSSRRLMWTNGGPSNARRAPVRLLPSIDDVVAKMVHWLPNWLLEQVDIDSSAPVNNPPATKIPLNFRNFPQYYDTFSKLVLLENWQYLFKGFREGVEFPRKVKIEHVRVVNDLMTLDCVCYITQRELKQGHFYKAEDFLLLEYVVNDENNFYMSLNFGFIQRCKKTTISNSDIISIKPDMREVGQLCQGEPHTKLEFTVLTRYQPDKDISTKKFPIVKLLTNIRAHLMLIRAIKGLVHSQICSKILYPKINEYKFPLTHRDIIQPHSLNPQQRSIVLEAASLCTGKSPGIYCIKGPPGTGKSTVIVNLVFQILFSHYVTNKTKEPPMILLAAPSNTAVDNLLAKLTSVKHKLASEWDKFKHQIKCVRIGPEASINKELIGYSLPKLAEKHIPLKNADLPEFKAARERNENLYEFSKTFFGDRYGHEIKMCEDLIIEKSNIICTTLNSCINGKLIEAANRGLIKFSCCIIDEATQCHEVEALLPTILGIEKFVLVGDPKQLNATVMNRDAFKLGFGESLFNRIANNFTNDPRTPIKMLTDQYRMHPEICAFPNRHFYDGSLRSLPRPPNKLPDKIRPYLVFNCEKISESADYTNIDEVHLIKKLLSTIFAMIDRNHKYTVGIITPYNAQKELINSNIVDLAFANEQNCKITVNTVDSFQGSENDIIIISCVRDSTNSFLQNANRLNVALTRAKQALYIVGNYTLFKECRPLYDLREDAKKRRLLLDIRQNALTIDNFSRYLLKKNSKN